jgi:hypothetical protein
MRIIFNIHSSPAAGAAGWRARAIKVNDKATALLDEALKAVTLADGSSIYDYIFKENCLGNDWILIVNGITVTDASHLKKDIKDNVQIHLMDNPYSGRKGTDLTYNN